MVVLGSKVITSLSSGRGFNGCALRCRDSKPPFSVLLINTSAYMSECVSFCAHALQIPNVCNARKIARTLQDRVPTLISPKRGGSPLAKRPFLCISSGLDP